MKTKFKCVIFGGNSPEHDISIITGMQLAKNVSGKFKLQKIYLGLDNNFYLATDVEDITYFNNKQNLKLKQVIDGEQGIRDALNAINDNMASLGEDYDSPALDEIIQPSNSAAVDDEFKKLMAE